MANFAVIEDGVVTNVILADSLAIAQEVTGKTCVEYTNESPAGIGWSYDGSTFTAPAAPTE